MSDSPVSVVIPTYNRSEMLRAALQSVLDQTLPAREIVVVDDGSTDHTREVVEDFERKGARVLFLTGPHRNERSQSRNRGAEATSAPLIAFLDSDDLWKPRRLDEQVRAMEQAPQAGFGFCNLQRFDDAGLIEGPCLDPRIDYNGAILAPLLQEPLVVSSTLLVRREAFEAVGGFTPMRMNEDYELSLKLASRYPASYVPEVLMLMREHTGRTSKQEDVTPLLDYVLIVRGFLHEHPDVPSGARSRARRGLANVHLKLARLYLTKGDRAAAREHLAACTRLRPWDRRLFGAYRQLLAPLTVPSAERG